MYSWLFNNPLLHFQSIYAIDDKNLIWKGPATFTPTLSGLIFISCLLFVEKGLPEAARIGEFILSWIQYHQQHIEDRSLSFFIELIRLRRFEMNVAKDHYAKPTCH